MKVPVSAKNVSLFRISNEMAAFDFLVMDDETYSEISQLEGLPSC